MARAERERERELSARPPETAVYYYTANGIYRGRAAAPFFLGPAPRFRGPYILAAPTHIFSRCQFGEFFARALFEPKRFSSRRYLFEIAPFVNTERMHFTCIFFFIFFFFLRGFRRQLFFCLRSKSRLNICLGSYSPKIPRNNRFWNEFTLLEKLPKIAAS